MKRRPARLAWLAVCLNLAGLAWAEEATALRLLTPESIPWPADAKTDAVAMAVLTGDPSRPGPYTVRYRLPAGIKLLPHWHPDSREVVILSGTFRYGLGKDFDPEHMYTLPPGSFFIEPAGQAHFAWTALGEVVLQASGSGPTATTYLAPAVDTPHH